MPRSDSTLPSSFAVAVALGALALGAGPARAADFDSGSSGALGDVTLSQDTVIALPADGVLHYASLTILNGVTVTFTPNARNTPVYVLATGDIVLEDDALIELSGADGGGSGIGGRGGPGGFDGGSHVDQQSQAGAGQGPGGGLSQLSGSGGNAGYATRGGGGLTMIAGNVYGSPLLLPLVGGSGGAGGGGRGGGGGGGAILLSSSTRIAIGFSAGVRSRGGAGYGGYQSGSGGAIRLVAPKVEGDGELDAGAGGSGTGRVRIDTLDASAMNLSHAGGFAVGSLMLSFLDVEPAIDLLGVGQTSIPLGHDGEFLVILPTGSAATQDLTVQLSDFVGSVPITIALTPEVGAPVFYDVDVDMAGATNDVLSVDVPVDFPANVPTVVHVWTRTTP